jgi:hypothetical protein
METHLSLGGLVVDSENTGNGLSYEANLGKLGGGTVGDLGHAELRKLKLEVVELAQELALGLLAKFVRLN